MAKKTDEKDQNTPAPEATTDDTKAAGPKTAKKSKPADVSSEDVALLQKQIASLQNIVLKQQDLIDAVADKGRLESYHKKRANPNERTFKIGRFQGKVVVGWKRMIKNTVELVEKGKWQETLKSTLIYADGSEEEVDYKQWQLNMERFEVIMVSQTTDAQGETTYLVKDKDGNEYQVNAKFVNA